MQKTSSCNWVKGLAEMFAARGLAVPALFRAAGIDPERLEDGGERFGVDEVSRLWELAVASSGDPALGLDRALTLKYVNFDVVGYAMLSSPDLRSGLAAFARYTALISDAATFGLQPADGGRAWLVLGHTGNTRPVPRQRFSYGLLSLLTLCQWLTRRDVQPLAAHFKFAEPPEVAAYHGAFACPLRFGQAENQLLLGAADLEAAIPSRNPSLLALHEHVMRERLAALGQAGTSCRVSDEIVRRLHRGEPRREDVAASLALADRTLQRRLHAENTSFQHLLDEARSELARKYLADSRYTLGEVAHQLGFGDSSNFFRACRRWFGLPPGQYREQLLGAQAAEPFSDIGRKNSVTAVP
ncbi:MAG: AraC family transcriptional regulator [Ramlibacter sp.]|nr:AraC family transcriptional regulator [Ramlibacter sp.]